MRPGSDTKYQSNTFESCVIHLSGMPMVPFIPSMSFPIFCFIICRRIASSRSATPVSQLKQARASTVTLHLLVESVVILLLFRVILLFTRYWHPSAKPSKAAILISIFGHVAYTNQPEFISICNQLRESINSYLPEHCPLISVTEKEVILIGLAG